MNIRSILWSVCILTSMFACKNDDDDTKPALEIPAVYESTNYTTNVAAEEAVITALGDVTGAISAAEKEDNTAAISYPGALKEITQSDYATKIESWLPEISKAAGNTFDLENAPTGEGGILGKRLLDENGLELKQVVEKGSFGAALYNHALSVTQASMTEASVDQLIEIFGANPDFDIEDLDYSARYTKRRSDNTNETGFFYEIKTALITAKAAIAAGSDYDTERNIALTAFLFNWEKANFATVIYYCNDAKAKILEANNKTDDEEKNNALGEALHAYSEAVGFTYGWLGLNTKTITDAQIQEILDLLLVSSDGTVESYQFATDATVLSNLDDAITKIQGIYGFSNTEVEGFEVNN